MGSIQGPICSQKSHKEVGSESHLDGYQPRRRKDAKHQRTKNLAFINFIFLFHDVRGTQCENKNNHVKVPVHGRELQGKKIVDIFCQLDKSGSKHNVCLCVFTT